MLSAYRQIRQFGFSLIELMIGLAVLAVVMGIAVPSFKVWAQNAKVRTVAESMLGGLQRARAEAVTRNANVSFVLGADASSWSVNVVGGTSNPIDSRSGNEAGAGVYLTVVPSVATTVTYNSLGGVTTNQDNSNAPTQITIDTSALPSGDNRPLRIMLGTGGIPKMCDPHAVYPSMSAC